MTFPTTLTGTLSDTTGDTTASGTFTATIFEDQLGVLSGSWVFSGTFSHSGGSFPHSGSTSLTGTLQGASTNTTTPGTSPWTIGLTGPNTFALASTLTQVGGQYSLAMNFGFIVNMGPTHIDLYQPTGTISVATALPVISIDTYTGSTPENAGSITVTLKRSSISGTSTVLLTTQDGSAVSSGVAKDFNAITDTTPGALFTFLPGDSTITRTFPGVIIDDTISEVNENFHIVLSNPTNATLGFSTGDVTIVDNDGTTVNDHFYYGTAGNDTINAGEGNNTVDAGEGANKITTGAGNDTIAAGAGNDTISAGAGTNVINAGGGANKITTGDGNDTITADAGSDTIVAGGGTNVISAGDGTNKITTLDGNDTITTGSGGDTIVAGAGNNAINAGDGANKVTTGAGNDSIITGNGADTIVAGGGNNTINAGDGANKITTLDGDDTITAGNGADTIVAGGGNNTINAGEGTNKVTTGAGNDTITTGSGNDTIVAGEGNNTVYAGGGTDKVTTGGGNDTIYGEAGTDTIVAGAGTDLLAGGDGNDTLTGGAGADVFRFDTAPNATTNLDRITDFLVGTDKIELENGIFSALATPGALAAGEFRGGSGIVSAADADDHLLYNNSTGALYYDADGTGLTAAVQIARLASNLALGAADFVVS